MLDKPRIRLNNLKTSLRLPGVLLVWIIVGQEPTVLVEGASGVVWTGQLNPK